MSQHVTVGPTVETRSKKGLRRVIRRRRGFAWRSSYAPFDRAPLGDPRNFLYCAGSLKVGAWFGFELKGSTLLAPGPDRLNWGLEQLQQQGATLPIRFESSEGYATDRQFVSAFARGVMPMAQEGLIWVHDVSFHAAVIFLPEEELRISRIQSQATLEFDAWVRAQLSPPNPIVLQALDEIMTEQAIAIDSGTGNTISTLSRGGFADDLYRYGYGELTWGGLSPRDLLWKRVVERGLERELSSALTSFVQSKAEDSTFFLGHRTTPENYRLRLLAKQLMIKNLIL